jgi:hypothetical protein
MRDDSTLRESMSDRLHGHMPEPAHHRLNLVVSEAAYTRLADLAGAHKRSVEDMATDLLGCALLDPDVLASLLSR